MCSDLPKLKVWAIADSKRQRYLGFVEFIIAMQLISLAQSGQPITQDLLSSGVELKNLKPPTIDGLDVLIAKKRHKEKEVDSNGSSPLQPSPSSSSWFSLKSTKKLKIYMEILSRLDMHFKWLVY
ncbi:EH domain-containing protein 1-like isoform X1 [Arachis hypogaea]|uniref:EH domain-containing protein 1-like isoform X1 n=2 Tax=Arachis hypogaea TaxID=3818 RepID=UPI003B21A1B7